MNNAIIQMANNTNFWVEFLELYKSLPALWNGRSETFKNSKIKAESYNKMLEKLKEIDPTANHEMVVRKIYTFRSTYRKEFKEVKYINTKLSGSGKTYKSSWFYFDLLSFIDFAMDYALSSPLDPLDPLEGTISSDEYKFSTSENKNSSISPKTKKILKKIKKQTDDETLRMKIKCDHLNKNKTNKIDYEKQKNKFLKKVIKQMDNETLVKIRCDHSNGINDKTNKMNYENQKEDNDETTILAKGLATQFAQLSNKQKLLSRKIISDVLFHGSLNHLTENTVQEIKNILRNPNWNNDYSMESEVIKTEMENTVQKIKNVDSPNWNNDYSMESKVKIEMEDYRMESEVKIEMEDYIE